MAAFAFPQITASVVSVVSGEEAVWTAEAESEESCLPA